ncbi:RNA methyltransferase [Treponema sp. OMZ 840]
MELSNIVVVLCNPNESKNIGSVCRAMVNTGLSRLRIVGTRADYKADVIQKLAVHSYHIWEQAEFYEDLSQAVNDCVFAAGTTRRRGQKRKNYSFLPEEFAQKVFSVPSNKVRAAVVFGNERTGLTDAELYMCNIAVTIPSNPASGSLNLSHAVQIIAYELYRRALPAASSYNPVALERLRHTVSVLADNLQRIGFFSLTGRTEMERFWLSVFSRAGLSEEEAGYIEKIFVKTAALALKDKSDIGI